MALTKRPYHYVIVDFSAFGGFPQYRLYGGSSEKEANLAAAHFQGLMSHVGITGPLKIEVSIHDFNGAGSIETALKTFLWWIEPVKSLGQSAGFLIAEDNHFNEHIRERFQAVRDQIPAAWLTLTEKQADKL